MSSDERTSKKLVSNASKKAKGVFTGEDGSVFWACKEIYNALKVGVQALNVQLSRASRYADERRAKPQQEEERDEYDTGRADKGRVTRASTEGRRGERNDSDAND